MSLKTILSAFALGCALTVQAQTTDSLATVVEEEERPMFHMGPFVLHEGLNMDFEAGVNVGFGKNNPWRGAGFFTNLTGIYAHSVNDRLTLAAGMTYGRYMGQGPSMGSLGIFGMANYRVNDKVDVTGFVAHDFGVIGGSRGRNAMHCGPINCGMGSVRPYGMGMSYYGMMGRMGYYGYPTPYMHGFGPSTTVGADINLKLGEHSNINIGVSFTREEATGCPPIPVKASAGRPMR